MLKSKEVSTKRIDDAVRFTINFLAIAVGVLAVAWVLGRVFAYYHRTGSFAIVVIAITPIAIFLFVTASRWVKWLPSLLFFGVMNSFMALITHRAPTNSDAVVSTGVASLQLVFYTVGCIVSNLYDSVHLDRVDRCSFLVYLTCIIWPAVASPNDLSVVTPPVTWSVCIGTTLLVAARATHQIRHKRFRSSL